MDDNIIDGKKLAQKKEAELKKRVSNLKFSPKVVSFLIGNNPASIMYTNMKQQKAKELGIDFEPLKYPNSSSFDEVKEKLVSLNNEPTIIGIMFQLPLSKEFLSGHKTEELLELIDPSKDIDGLNSKHSSFIPATVKGVMSILDVILATKRSPESRKVGLNPDSGVTLFPRMTDIIFAVVGSEGEVGQSLVYELSNRDATVIKVDKKLPDTNLEDIKNASVVISATGVKDLIKPEHLKDNVILIDVGLGDFHKNCYLIASFYTPKVGGTGPMTVISLMENIIEGAEGL